MEQQNSQFKSYFLGTLDAEEADGVELQILEETEFAEMLELAENDLIEEYLDGGLSINDQKAFEQNYLISVSRRKKVEFLKAIKTFAKHQSKIINVPKPSFFETLKLKFSLRPPLLAFGTVALICAVGITSYFVWKNSTNKSEVLISLNKVYKNERPLESRISDFDYAPKVEGTRGANDKANDDLDFVELSARTTVKQNPTAENLHTLGQVYLTKKDFDKAIEQFEKAIKQNPNIAKIYNDLGVALLEKATPIKADCDSKAKLKQECNDEKEPYLELFTKANEEFAKAIESDKNLTEAYFNQALCLDLQGFTPYQTKEAWENYLKLDSTSPWADEARKKLQAIETTKPVSKTKEEILQEFLTAKNAGDDDKAWEIISRNREMITGKLIPQQLTFLFVDSKTTGDETKAKIALDALVYVGKLEEEKSGDFFWRDLAKYYKNVSGNKIANLKSAQDSFRKGNELCLNGKYQDAFYEFESSEKMFLSSKNIFELKLLDTMTTYVKTRLGKLKESSNELLELANVCKQNNYKWLHSQALLWLGINANSLKLFSDSISDLDKALVSAIETNDLYGQEQILGTISTTYFQIGQYDKALVFTQRNLELSKLPDTTPRQKWRDLSSAGKLFYELNFLHTSILIEQEALFLSINYLDEKTFDYTNYIDLGLMYGKFGDFEKAFEFIAKGQNTAEHFVGRFKELCFAYTNLKLGHINRQTKSYQKAAENYEQAIKFYDSDEFQANGYEAHKGLLLNYLAENNDDDFQKELPNLIEIFNDYRTKIREEENRNSFFDNEQDVYDIAVDYEFGKANFVAAFDYVEESRSRSLLDLQNADIQVLMRENQPDIKFPANLQKPLKLNQIQAEMPENTQLLEYSVLQDKVLIWSITKYSLNAVKTDISADSLQKKVSNYQELVSKNIEPDAQLNLSKELYQLLITPIKDKLDVSKEVFIIPDKVLTQLSFATLFSGKYLIEEFKISYSPSANIFLICSGKAKDLNSQTPEILLSIGNPTFNQTEYKNKLPLLPSAKIEAEEVAKVYKNPIVLTENNAIKGRIKENLKTADVVHFAGHYLVDEHLPLLSIFVLAGNKESGLANYEIIGEKLLHTRLIVLSACETGVETYYKGEGMTGASRTFLATGVPIVVASQWSVDSEATKDLMIRFHQLRKTEKLSTAEALRQSQIEMLKSEKYKQPYYWATFAAIGGYAQF
jgi:CHAT domain-containing protein